MNKKNIGSFFEFKINLFNNELYNNYIKNKNLFFFITGRTAIKYILNNISNNNFLLPNYLCESIFNNFINKNFSFYTINNNLTINYSYLKNLILLQKYDAIYIIDYFGIIDENINKIINLCEKNNILIIQDYTHSNNYKNLYGNICINSFRKRLPVVSGALIYDKKNILPKQNIYPSFKNILFCVIKLFLMFLKHFKYLKFIWYKTLCLLENKIDMLTDCNYDYFNNFLYIFYNKNNYNRMNNFIYLKNNCILKPLCIVSKYIFTYPVICKTEKERNKIKNILIKNNIYPMILWSTEFGINYKLNHNLSNKILCLPIDERYNYNDMKYICNIINENY